MREKKKMRLTKKKKKERNVANGAFTMSRRLHMRLLSGLGTPRASRAALARPPVFQLSISRSPLCGAHTPIFSACIHLCRSLAPPHHRLSARFLHFSFVYRVSTIARATVPLSFIYGGPRAILIIIAALSSSRARLRSAMTPHFRFSFVVSRGKEDCPRVHIRWQSQN